MSASRRVIGCTTRRKHSSVRIDPISAALLMASDDPMHVFVSQRLEEWLSFPETDDEARILMLE